MLLYFHACSNRRMARTAWSEWDVMERNPGQLWLLWLLFLGSFGEASKYGLYCILRKLSELSFGLVTPPRWLILNLRLISIVHQSQLGNFEQMSWEHLFKIKYRTEVSGSLCARLSSSWMQHGIKTIEGIYSSICHEEPLYSLLTRCCLQPLANLWDHMWHMIGALKGFIQGTLQEHMKNCIEYLLSL